MSEMKCKTKLICPLTSRTVEAMRTDMIAAAADGADMVECRLDFLTNLPDDEQLHDLLACPPVPVIVTCRPTRQGGLYEGEERHRLSILARADLIGKVAAIDIEEDVPRAERPRFSHSQTILSHHNFKRCPDNLDEIAASMEASAADVNKIAFTPAGPDEALRAFDIIRKCNKPTLVLAMGEAGLISRILAKKFAGWGTFASLHAGAESAPGQPSLAEIRHLYRWDDLNGETEVYGVIGCPIAHSMSPAIHNAAFTTARRNAVYVPLRIEPGAENFNRFMDAVAARPWLGLRGLSVTIPHKENALAYVGPENCDELAVRIGAVNTITISQAGQLRGDNTDYAGAIDALCAKMKIGREGLASRRVTVLGAGGAGRAIVAAFSHYGAAVTLCNRTLSRAEALADEFGCDALPLEQADQTQPEIIINCTAIGMHPNVDDCPLAAIPAGTKVVFDTVYNPLHTKLLTLAQASGAQIVTGLDMFVNQAAAQYELWTQSRPPVEVMRNVVANCLEH